MKLLVFQTLWGWKGSAEKAEGVRVEEGFDGFEGMMREGWEDLLREREYVGEVVTGGDYVPVGRKGVQAHLDDLSRGVELCLRGEPRMVNVMGGCDWWEFGEKVRFVEGFLEVERALGVPLSLETHRSRVTFHPWVTRDLLREVPEVGVTCDFSHWCCVCERLVMDEEQELLELLAGRCRHVHGRVGYGQGPQVPDPMLETFAQELAGHERWWRVLWDAGVAGGQREFTMTPEFGPDGYQQEDAWGRVEVPELMELNAGMGRWWRERFGGFGRGGE
ncbi:MAG: sugar phosphate isomerase/epimerase [Verrucomicrobiota bacterium]